MSRSCFQPLLFHLKKKTSQYTREKKKKTIIQIRTFSLASQFTKMKVVITIVIACLLHESSSLKCYECAHGYDHVPDCDHQRLITCQDGDDYCVTVGYRWYMWFVKGDLQGKYLLKGCHHECPESLRFANGEVMSFGIWISCCKDSYCNSY